MWKEERGATMIEMIGVIAIIGIVTAGMWKVAASGWSRYRMSQAVSQLQSLQKNIVRRYAAAGNYNELSENNILEEFHKDKLLPAQMAYANGKAYHTFGGEITVNVGEIVGWGESSHSFKITYKNLTFAQCAEMASISWIGNDFANIVSIQVGTSKFEWPSSSSSDSDNVLPLTRAKASSVCAGGSKDVIWEFR